MSPSCARATGPPCCSGQPRPHPRGWRPPVRRAEYAPPGNDGVAIVRSRQAGVDEIEDRRRRNRVRRFDGSIRARRFAPHVDQEGDRRESRCDDRAAPCPGMQATEPMFSRASTSNHHVTPSTSATEMPGTCERSLLGGILRDWRGLRRSVVWPRGELVPAPAALLRCRAGPGAREWLSLPGICPRARRLRRRQFYARAGRQPGPSRGLSNTYISGGLLAFHLLTGRACN